MYKPTEKRFEDQIESFLKSIGYIKNTNLLYDKRLCLIPSVFIEFIKNSQNEKYQSLKDQLFDEVDNQILKRLDDEITYFGIVHVLKKGFNVRDKAFQVMINIPRSKNNPDHIEDYKKNIFSLIRQLKFNEQTEQSIDTVIFLNGIPLCSIELKNQLTNQSIEDAITQYKNDRDPINKLLKFNRCLVHFGVDNDQVVMTTNLNKEKTKFFPFNKAIINPLTDGYRSEYLWKEVLIKDSLINIIERFVHISEIKSFKYNPTKKKVEEVINKSLIFPRYHQLEIINNITKQLNDEGVGGNFLIQHTTGSGKSYEIGWLTHTLSSFYKDIDDTKKLFDTVIVVTDRNVLDEQLRNIIENLQDVKGVVNSVVEDSTQLKKFLEEGKSIIITTIQKFPVISKSLKINHSRNYAVIFDEVHSSQGGKSTQELKRSISNKDNESSNDYDELILNEIKIKGKKNNVSFFGFTGTPKKETLEIFGRNKEGEKNKKAFHSYTMEQSIHEGFTLNVLKNFTYYKRYFKLKELENDIEISSSKSKSQIFNFVDDQEITINNKISIILDHFLNKTLHEINGQSRAMIVVSSRPHCVKYFRKINEELINRGSNLKCLVGFSKFDDDDTNQTYDEKTLNREVGLEESIPIGLKYPQFRLLVVSSKFQTGFDEPNLQSMYIDKNLNDIQCVQTLSRLNRITDGKKRTFILDFKNTPEKVQSSFQKFYGSINLINEADPEKLHDVLTKIKFFNIIDYLDVKKFCGIYNSIPRKDEHLQPPLNNTLLLFQKLDDERKKEFKVLLNRFVEYYDLVIQVIDYKVIEHFEYYQYFENLVTKLQTEKTKTRDISEFLRLSSLKIDKNFEGEKTLESSDAEIEGINIDSDNFFEDGVINLKELIKSINEIYHTNFSDNDRTKFNDIKSSVIDDKLKNIVLGDNTSIDSKKIIFEKIKNVIYKTYDSDYEFFKKINENPSVINTLSNIVYKEIISNK